MIPKTAIILAGGKGTRLKETIPGLAKVLAPVNGKPFLDYILKYFMAAGIERFIFSLGFHYEQVTVFLEEEYSTLSHTIIVEYVPLGTGGAIKKAMEHSGENTLAVINGDTLFKVKLNSMSAFHHMCGAECTIALKSMSSFDRYGEVTLNRDYSIASFNEKKQVSEGLINGGFYILNKRLFDENVFPEKFSFEEDYLAKKFKQRRIFGVRQEGYFIDIGVPEDYRRAQEEFKQER
jgi:D-glycero-alpha-D-manno-heptose 1-phosphate guanylyltransferase